MKPIQLRAMCQSCGTPILRRADCGTDALGHRVNDYCHDCLAAGAFMEPRISMQEMIDRSVARLTERNVMPEAEAIALMCEVMPKLKRWQEARRGHPAPAC